MQKNASLEQQVLAHVNRENYRPVKPRIIAKQLDLTEDQLRDLKRTIKRLVKRGQLAYGPKHLVLKSAAAATPSSKPGKRKSGSGKSAQSRPRNNEVVGRFSRAAGGFGFVIVTPDETAGPDEATVDDVYIPQSRSLDASTGDIVRARLTDQRQKGRLKTSGRIIEVIERRTHRFVGTYQESGEYGLVAIDGNQFEGSVLVGDASARAARVNDKVVVEMVRFPGQNQRGDFQPGEAVVVQVLGDRGTPGVDTLTIIAEYGLPGEFSDEVLDDARDQAEEFDESITDNRTDFTGETVVTIDPLTARDFDDAISLKRIENGHWLLGVHIADVSHFVRPGTELDNEAFSRATSVYLPDRVIPMLPEVISNNLASLQPDRVRYTMSAQIEFSDEGVPISTELHRGAIKSCHRFNYEEIDDYLADDSDWKRKLAPDVFRLVRDMHGLAMTLRRRRMDRGSFDLIIPEVEIDLDKDGRVCGAHTRKQTESHQVIEEFMVAANEAVARHLRDLELYLMRRIHESPSPVKLADLKTMMADLGYPSGDIQSRFELKRIIEEARDTPTGPAVHFAILRSMQKAIYSPRELGHYALASDAYCHFTSPIRRYPDLIIHRMIGDLLDGKKPASDFGRLQQLALHCSDMEQRAEKAERDLIKLKLINFLHERIGMEMDAIVTGVETFGMFAQGVELPASGFIPVDSLPRDRYVFDRGTRTLQGFRDGNRFRLGDALRIRVVSADPDRREIEYAVVDTKGSSSSSKKSDRKKSDRKPSDRKSSDRKSSDRSRRSAKSSSNAKSNSNSNVKSKPKSKTKSGSKPGGRGDSGQKPKKHK